MRAVNLHLGGATAGNKLLKQLPPGAGEAYSCMRERTYARSARGTLFEVSVNQFRDLPAGLTDRLR